MSAHILDGKQTAALLREKVRRNAEAFLQQHSRSPALAVILVGEDPASQVYVRNKVRASHKAGIVSLEHRLSAQTRQEDLIALVQSLNQDQEIDGILVQLPLPNSIDSQAVIASISPEKDVDGLTEKNQGRLVLGKEGLRPCTPQGCVLLAEKALGDLTGHTVLILGRSILVGKPAALLFLEKNATPILTHSRTKNLKKWVQQADILVAAVGQPSLVKASWIKAGACILDVGINRVETSEGSRLVGDVDYESVCKVAGFITPVPGGVGPMTIACLLQNTILAAYRRLESPIPFCMT